MFDGLSEKLNVAFKKLRGQGKLTENNIKDALRDVRVALLEADVNYRVVKNFINDVKEKAMGQQVLLNVTPGQQFVKIVESQLTELMGGQAAPLNLKGQTPIVFMLVGLQGSGKTTTCGKLGLYLQNSGKRSLLVSVDVYRPAAILQLKTISENQNLDFFEAGALNDPIQICREAIKKSKAENYDALIIDTAGRLHIDEKLMGELENIKKVVYPQEILFVADSMTGQDAVNVAEEFDARLDITGVVLTKLDGDARGGAALSIRAVTGKHIKMVGTGEKFNAFEVFHPERMASRILDMGDIVTLVEKAQATFDTKKAEELEKKIRKNAFTFEDFKDQLVQMQKMGSMDEILSMLPGMKQLKKMKGFMVDEDELKKVVAIINSMTKQERSDHTVINGSRRKRIARGSGTSVEEVNKLIKNFVQAQKMIKKINKMGMPGLRQMLPM